MAFSGVATELHIAEWLGLAAAVLSSAFGIPQLWRLARGATAAGVSSASWWLTACAGFVWLPHNWSRGEWAAFGANAFSAIGALAVLARHLTMGWGVRSSRIAGVVPLGVTAVAAVVLLTGWLSPGWVAAGLGLSRFVPQTVAVLFGSDNAGVSLWTWTLAGLSAVLWIAYGVLHRDAAVVLPALVAVPMALLIVIRVGLARRPAEVGAGS